MRRTWKLGINSFLSTLGDKRSGLKNLCSADLKSFRCTLLGRNPSTLEMEEFKRLLNTPWGITNLVSFVVSVLVYRLSVYYTHT